MLGLYPWPAEDFYGLKKQTIIKTGALNLKPGKMSLYLSSPQDLLASCHGIGQGHLVLPHHIAIHA